MLFMIFPRVTVTWGRHLRKNREQQRTPDIALSGVSLLVMFFVLLILYFSYLAGLCPKVTSKSLASYSPFTTRCTVMVTVSSAT